MQGSSVVDWGVGKTSLSGCSVPAGEMAPLDTMAVSVIEKSRNIEEGVIVNANAVACLAVEDSPLDHHIRHTRDPRCVRSGISGSRSRRRKAVLITRNGT